MVAFAEPANNFAGTNYFNRSEAGAVLTFSACGARQAPEKAESVKPAQLAPPTLDVMRAQVLSGLVVATLACLPAIRAVTSSSASPIVKDKFHLDRAGEDQVGYAQSVRVGSTIYISGSVGEGPDMRTQLREAYASIEKSLSHYGATFQNVVKENIYTTDLDEMIRQKDVRSPFYQGDWPAASWVGVHSLYVPALLVQVEVIAELPHTDDLTNR